MTTADQILSKVPLIGRDKIVEDILKIQPQTGCHLVFIEGDAGIGKTYLLNHLLSSFNNSVQAPCVLPHVIDLYHINTHSAEGFSEAIVEMFPRDTSVFLNYQKAHQNLERARAAGESKTASKLLEVLLNVCSDELSKVSAERGLIFALDTAERWVYRLGEQEIQTAQAWDWFLTLLKNLPQAVVLIAGRAQINHLVDNVSALNPTHIYLTDFGSEQTKEYIEKVSVLSINPLEFGTGDINRIYELSAGRPNLISLYLRFYLMDSGKAKNLLEKKSVKEFSEEIVNNMLSDPDLTDILPAMGRAPKGIDLSLLKRFMQNVNDNVENRFENLKKYTFVKTFEGTDRLFLHEAMYSLLKEVVYSKPQDPVDQDAASKIIEGYYYAGISELSHELGEIYKERYSEDWLDQDAAKRTVQGYDDQGFPNLGRALGEIYSDKLDEQSSVDETVDKVRNLERKRHILYSDLIYYQLRDNIVIGLQSYYRYIHQAALNGESELLQLLRSELLEYLSKLDVSHPHNHFQLPFIRGMLVSTSVLETVATMSGDRLGKIQQAIHEIEQIPGITKSETNILKALLLPWASVTQISSGNHTDAKETLRESIQLLDEVTLSPNNWLEWFYNIAEAFTHRQYGYSYRVQGEINKAITEYGIALNFVQGLNFLPEEATLRNDLGFAKAELGDFQNARREIQLGLKERYDLGDGRQIALSLSTLAQCALREGSFDDAMKSAKRAVEIAKILQDQRSFGLALLGLAEAKRRTARSDDALSYRTRKRLLVEAQEHSTQALDIFTIIIPEMPRAIEARIEEGCAVRDMVYIRSNEPSITHYSLEQLKETADMSLQDAVKRAIKQNIFYRQVDALVNRAWLAYYYGDESFRQIAIKDAEAAFDKQYHFGTDGKVGISDSEANRFLWTQLGKLYICKGHISFDAWLNNNDEDQMLLAAEDYLLGLEYSVRFSQTHRGLRQGRDSVFFRLNNLNKDQLRSFSNAIVHAEKKYSFSEQSQLQTLIRDGGLWYRK